MGITIAKAYKLRQRIVEASVSLPDEDAIEAVELFENWKPGQDYIVGKRLRYIDKLYKVNQAHISQSDWTPDITPALYTEVAKPGEIPVWRQPTGAQDAYNTGDKVHFPTASDPVYESTIDNNVWSPADYPQGWQLVE